MMKRRKQIKPYVRRKPGGNKKIVGVCSHMKNLSYSQANKQGFKLSKNGDYDKDGVINSKDCKPFDPKRQGWLHDQKMKVLKKQEEYYENKREKEQKKFEDVKDELQVRNKISQAKISKKRLEMAEKQARIDEIIREKKKIQELKIANVKAKTELDKYTVWGAVKRGVVASGKGLGVAAVASVKALEKTDKFLSKQSTTTKRKKVRKTKKATVKKTKRKKKKEESWL